MLFEYFVRNLPEPGEAKFSMASLTLVLSGLRVASVDANPLRSVTVERSGSHLVEPVTLAGVLLGTEPNGNAVHGVNEKRVDCLGANNSEGGVDVGHTSEASRSEVEYETV